MARPPLLWEILECVDTFASSGEKKGSVAALKDGLLFILGLGTKHFWFSKNNHQFWYKISKVLGIKDPPPPGLEIFPHDLLFCF